jgi:hypothetical protein
MSDGESMFAFQICDITQTDQKICHCEFLGCIAEDVEDEDNVGTETIDSKRGESLVRQIIVAANYCSILYYTMSLTSIHLLSGINDNDMDDADVCAHDSKRIKRSSS